MEPPYHEMSPMRVLLKIQKSDPPSLDRPSRWSKEFNDFIRLCLTKDPQQRPRVEELLKVRNHENHTLSQKHGMINSVTIYLFICILCVLFQHPFIRNATDPKPILDLLTEFKAEIVDEKIEDLDDTEVSDFLGIFEYQVTNQKYKIMKIKLR